MKTSIKKLLIFGANVNLMTQFNQSVLYFACLHCSDEIQLLLLEHPNIVVNDEVCYGQSIVHILCAKVGPAKEPVVLKKLLQMPSIPVQEGLFARVCKYRTQAHRIKVLDLLLQFGKVKLSLKEQYTAFAKMDSCDRDEIFELIAKHTKNGYPW